MGADRHLSRRPISDEAFTSILLFLGPHRGSETKERKETSSRIYVW